MKNIVAIGMYQEKLQWCWYGWSEYITDPLSSSTFVEGINSRGIGLHSKLSAKNFFLQGDI